MRKWIGIMSMELVMVACQPTKPQRPTFQGTAQVDTAVVQLLTMNQQMAQQADLQLAKMAGKGYVLMDENYWVKNLYPQSDLLPTLREGEYIEFQAEFYSLNGHLLTTHQASAKLGQVDEAQAIALVLTHLQRGQSVSMLVPWYLAFGSAGNADVPPYENVRIELSVR